MTSSRVPANLTPNRLAQVRAARELAGLPILDLTASNPTRAGFSYPADLLEPLGDPRALVYAPEPFGLIDARAAVAGDFARRGLSVAADRVVLTASTSEAYSWLFKLLCAPGDEVLVPRPSYPLFEHLTRLDAVTPVAYDLEYHQRWAIDLPSLAQRFTDRTRALLVVNPNNPTGHFLSRAELDEVAGLCRAHGTAMLSDEVFADYELRPDTGADRGVVIARRDVLAFTLGGLSKSIGLPQVKLAWIAMSGPDEALKAAHARLELIADTYLSVSTPVQAATRELLERGAGIRTAIAQRVRRNYQAAGEAVARVPACEMLRAEAGWYAVLRVPSLMSEEDTVLSLLREDGVLAHPGYFFDFPAESFLVVSLLTPEHLFDEGLAHILRRFTRLEGIR